MARFTRRTARRGSFAVAEAGGARPRCVRVCAQCVVRSARCAIYARANKLHKRTTHTTRGYLRLKWGTLGSN